MHGGAVHGLQHRQRHSYRLRLANDAELVATIVNFHPEAALDLPHMFIEMPAQIGKALIVFGLQQQVLKMDGGIQRRGVSGKLLEGMGSWGCWQLAHQAPTQ